ncbi:MAG: hypothetical protein BGO68_05175 [Candidatus Amoebophilus sp. 36-38]|nr:MAG: hypothetical protein BGO68_05175 [Candidatus Amoebophilus sp. 36-38]
MSKIQEGQILTEQLYDQAEQFLVAAKIALPSSKQLKRMISSICSKHQQKLFKKLYQNSSENLIKSIEEILTLPVGETYTYFQKFKEYPTSATITLLENYLGKYRQISKLDLDYAELEVFSSEFITHLYKLGKYYSADAIKRFKPEKRNAIMIGFLAETKKVLLDYIIQIHDQYISNICRECKNIHEDNLSQYKNKHEKAVEKIVLFIDELLVTDKKEKVLLSDIWKGSISKEGLAKAREDMTGYLSYGRLGYANLLQNRYSSMRRYFADFIQLPFEAEQGSKSLMKAIEIIRTLDQKGKNSLPANTPYHFIDYKISKAIFNQDGSIRRSIWEIGVAIAIRDALRSGDLYLPESKKFTSFWKLIYNNQEWEQEREIAYKELDIELDANNAIEKLITTFNDTASKAAKAFGVDGFAQIKNNQLKLTKQDKLEEPEETRKLQKVINSYLPKIKVERLLIEVDYTTGFSKYFTPIHSQKSKPANFYKALMASILSQATNIGIATMENCTTGISSEMMRYIIDTYIREGTINQANAEIVNLHTSLPLSNIHGKGTISSSDAQRFGVTASSLISSFYPRYFGYYEKAIGIYTHVSDQYSVFNTKVISCAPREALYVLDGLLENNTLLEIKEHTTDTQGYTEHIFALCFLLGYQFMPRIKDLKDQQLYRVSRDNDYGVLDVLLNKYLDLDIIKEQMDQMVRIATSLKRKLVPAHEIVRRLSKGGPSDRLTKAFTQLGRLIKTSYILRYITQEELRLKVQRQLNKGEHRHALSRWIFFANHGKFQVGDYEEIMNKASCLRLVSNAVLLWNTLKMSEIITQLKASGTLIDERCLSHISLLPYKHVIPMGTYFVDDIKDKEELTYL